MNTLSVNLDLVRKYGGQGPRYTSYPTALKFTEEFESDRLIAELKEKAQSPQKLSLYCHLPFCESMCWFCGCTKIVSKDHSKAEPYLDYLQKEIDLYKDFINPKSQAVQLHLGGGTPNYLSPDQIDRLTDILSQNFHFHEKAERSVELDPRRLTQEHIFAFRKMGITRASFGVQDLNPIVQKAINRIQPERTCYEAVKWIRDENFESLNIDLIYGLPFQTVSSFEKTVKKVIKWNPDRFAIFNYAHVPWMMKGQTLIKESDMPTPETKLEMLKMVTELLTSHGYEYIGMDHFAKSDDELAKAQKAKTLQRNFQGYSTWADTDIYAFGLSSISQSDSHYRQNHKALPDYYKALDRNELPIAKALYTTEDDRIRRETIMRLMCDLELNYAKLSNKLGIDFTDYFSSELESFKEAESDGMVSINNDVLTVSDMGRLIIRNLAMKFDAYSKQNLDRFSKTI
ncbi:oxygen-independent coproporphyrinogen III oxidase [Puniceicoccaceae bacterium K14]|nr:oxygen-independent coproporphyrinogen III oxidase [Puniceicoccaceae bacterium K14]